MSENGVAMPTVGVVIPLYRCAPYVRGCLESVLAQTHPLDEIVLVDDRGGDDTVSVATAVLDEHGRDYTLVTHPRNEGLGRARNTGLRALSTDLVWFLDSDDQADPEFVECLLAALRQGEADIAVCRTHRVDLDGRVLQIDEAPRPAPTVTGVAYARELILGRAKGYACTKLFRREVLGDRPWAEGRAYEDMVTSVRVAVSCDTVAMVDRPLYNYLYRAGSISTALSPATFDLFTVETEIGDLLADAQLEARWRLDFTGYRYREVLTPVAHLAMRDGHARGPSTLQRTAIRRVRDDIAVGDMAALWRGGYHRQLVFAIAVKWWPGVYSRILRHR